MSASSAKPLPLWQVCCEGWGARKSWHRQGFSWAEPLCILKGGFQRQLLVEEADRELEFSCTGLRCNKEASANPLSAPEWESCLWSGGNSTRSDTPSTPPWGSFPHFFCRRKKWPALVFLNVWSSPCFLCALPWFLCALLNVYFLHDIWMTPCLGTE